MKFQKALEVAGPNIFTLHNQKLSLHCRLSQEVPYKQEDGRSIGRQLILAYKIIFSEYDLQKNNVKGRW